ncbi:RING-H2 finger protein ATL18-like [Durio zibethinus]|uniref:RING-H2 finger protein ATL18-like n=1 Tax=Durio zibethinus TaxID=66656 RepID=A0A6P6AC29_DURZI|nr:RING-H2 finger protein ATL18-like [Durio zibethinus]
MISLMCSNSDLSTAALIFYTCVWIPYLQLKKALLRVLGFVFPWYQAEESCQVMNVCLPVARFEDLKLSNGSRGSTNGEEVEEVCSICLVEFEKEDVVSQLHKCGHLFHMNCIEKWLDRDQFTCPLCRSFLFANTNSSHTKCGTDSPQTTSNLLSSWLSF